MTVRTESTGGGGQCEALGGAIRGEKANLNQQRTGHNSGPPRRLFTFKQFAQRHPAFSESSLRWMRFNQEENDFARAFIKVGSRVLIDEVDFFEAIDRQNSDSSQGGGR